MSDRKSVAKLPASENKIPEQSPPLLTFLFGSKPKAAELFAKSNAPKSTPAEEQKQNSKVSKTPEGAAKNESETKPKQPSPGSRSPSVPKSRKKKHRSSVGSKAARSAAKTEQGASNRTARIEQTKAKVAEENVKHHEKSDGLHFKPNKFDRFQLLIQAPKTEVKIPIPGTLDRHLVAEVSPDRQAAPLDYTRKTLDRKPQQSELAKKTERANPTEHSRSSALVQIEPLDLTMKKKPRSSSATAGLNQGRDAPQIVKHKKSTTRSRPKNRLSKSFPMAKAHSKNRWLHRIQDIQKRIESRKTKSYRSIKHFGQPLPSPTEALPLAMSTGTDTPVSKESPLGGNPSNWNEAPPVGNPPNRNEAPAVGDPPYGKEAPLVGNPPIWKEAPPVENSPLWKGAPLVGNPLKRPMETSTEKPLGNTTPNPFAFVCASGKKHGVAATGEPVAKSTSGKTLKNERAAENAQGKEICPLRPAKQTAAPLGVQNPKGVGAAASPAVEPDGKRNRKEQQSGFSEQAKHKQTAMENFLSTLIERIDTEVVLLDGLPALKFAGPPGYREVVLHDQFEIRNHMLDRVAPTWEVN